MEQGKGYQRGSFTGTNVYKNGLNLGQIVVDEATGLPQFAPVTVDHAAGTAALCADVAAAKLTQYAVWLADDAQLFYNSICGEEVVADEDYVRIFDLGSVAGGAIAGYMTPFAITTNPTNLTIGTFLVASTGGLWIVDADPVTNGYAFYLEILAVIEDTGVGLSYHFRVVKS